MRLWTRRFVAALAFIGLFIVNATWNPIDETTGKRPPLLRFTNEKFFSTLFSFVFLLVALFAISHAGSWVFHKLRRGGQEEAPEPAKKKSKRKKR